MVAGQPETSSLLAYRRTLRMIKNPRFEMIDELLQQISRCFGSDMPGQIVEAVLQLVLEGLCIFNLTYRHCLPGPAGYPEGWRRRPSYPL